MSNRLIRAGFETIVSTWAGAQSPAIPIAWQNAAFTPPTGRYLRVFLLPGQTGSDDMEGLQRTFVGVFQVSICVPLGEGSGPAQLLEDAIIALYPKETEIVITGGLRVRLTRPMSAAPPIPDKTHHIVPLSFSYRLDN